MEEPLTPPDKTKSPSKEGGGEKEDRAQKNLPLSEAKRVSKRPEREDQMETIGAQTVPPRNQNIVLLDIREKSKP